MKCDRKAWKFVENCEYRLFQRPDDAIYRGFDKQTEYDFSIDGHFISNFQPLDKEDVKLITRDVVRLYQYTEPMRNTLLDFVKPTDNFKYCVSSSCPRLIANPAYKPDESATKQPAKKLSAFMRYHKTKEGEIPQFLPSNNVRYLQRRPDMLTPMETYLTYQSIRLFRKLKSNDPVHVPVDAVLSGRRNNPPQVTKTGMKLRPLSVFAPLHYFEYPELMMEYITSMTGASPSMTSAGSEGALTKGPFNSLPAVVDLNNSLLGMILCGYRGFVSSANYCGPKYKIAHDISLLIPEVWSRMRPFEQDPLFLIENGYLEKCPDVEYKGKTLDGSRLGYRITDKFCTHFLGDVFAIPKSVMPEDFLKPELQNSEVYADSYDFITSSDREITKVYIEDKTVEGAIPPLKALIYIMATGSYNGMTRTSKEFREMFTYENVVNSEWYKERLVMRQKVELKHLRKELDYLKKFKEEKPSMLVKKVNKNIDEVEKEIKYVASDDYINDIFGSLGTDTYCYNN